MKGGWLPGGNEVLRETVIILAGAAVAAALMYLAPAKYKQWLKDAWK